MTSCSFDISRENNATPLPEYPAQAPVPVDETTPQFRDIRFEGILCDGAARAVCINGLPEMPVQGITINGSRFRSARGIEIRRASDITLHDIVLQNNVGDPLWTADVENLQSDL